LFEDLKKPNITSNWRDVVQDGFSIQGIEIGADALFLDVPNPWAAITHAKKALKKSKFISNIDGRICCFSPCI
jgi:tRNA (adenine57-N1/adenine58-N1)-methyltransferase